MTRKEARTAIVRLLLPRADEEIFRQAATARHQTLQVFLAETLSVVAVDLRTPPRPRLSWLDVYQRHAPAPKPEQDDPGVRYSPERLLRPPRPPAKPR